MATEFDDFIFFTGTMQQINTILVNPYSSKTYLIDDEYNVNNSAYDGLGGTGDILFMTNSGDMLTLTDGFGVQLVKNMEIFIAGDGGDIINLADATVTYEDVQLLGGNGDDILWGNVGNDLINGGGGNDIIDGGPGNDELIGGVVGLGVSDDDQIFGGAGDDILRGNDGNDILYGGTDLGLMDLDKDFMDTISFPDLASNVNIVDLVPPGVSSLGIYADNLKVDFQATAELTFRDGFAGYENTLAIYEVGENGEIQNVQVLWGNVKDAGVNNTYTIDIPTGADGGEFGFFIVADGYTRNNDYAGLDVEGAGNISIIYDYGGANERLGTVFDDGNMLSTVYNDGVTEFALNGYTYHTTARGGDNSINHDGMTHVVSGLANDGDGEVFRIGFEDLPSLGDADFEDVLFDFNINEVRVDASEPGNDLLDGGAGDDILYGEAGDDLLIVGEGYDQMYGGTGNDTFQFTVADALVDDIKDFTLGDDVIDISEVLSFGDNVGDLIEEFVMLVQNGADTEIHIDADGLANGSSFAALAIVEGGVGDTLTQLISNGDLIV